MNVKYNVDRLVSHQMCVVLCGDLAGNRQRPQARSDARYSTNKTRPRRLLRLRIAAQAAELLLS